MTTPSFFNFEKNIQNSINEEKSFFVKMELKKLLSEMSIFSPMLLNLANLSRVNVDIIIFWNYQQKHNFIEFQEFLHRIFEEGTDHHGIDYVLKDTNTYVVILQIEILHNNERKIIALATNTILNDCHQNSYVSVMDYIALTDISPRSFLTNYNQSKFQGKGIGRLLINIIQVLNHVVSRGKCKYIVIKCDRELESMYKSFGFQKIAKSDPLMKSPSIKYHFIQMKQNSSLIPYKLTNNHVVGYSFGKLFFNHVQREIQDEEFDQTEMKSIVNNLHQYFATGQF